jgi:hypothetical protein
MVYFDVDEIKADLNIKGTTQDAQINSNWGPKSDNEVDDRIYTTASKARRIISLPILPLTGTAITPTIISASNHYVKKKYYQSTRNKDMMDAEDKAAQQDINAYLARLNVDAVYYGRIMR